MGAWDRIERSLAGLLGAGALAVGLYQVFSRYIDPKLAVGWGDEVVVYLTVWAIFIIASQLVRSDGHVRPDIVLRLLPPGGQRIAEIFNCLVALVFCGGLAWFGIAICADAIASDERSSTGLAFPMWLYYAALPVGSGLMVIRYLARLYRFAFRFDPATMSIRTGHEA
ncbi:MAG: TRAP transporter small permease [Alphaproteobacteria bacterium]|nr:TRAP transporter small permease [Alphaproteobacteria bacterium]